MVIVTVMFQNNLCHAEGKAAAAEHSSSPATADRSPASSASGTRKSKPSRPVSDNSSKDYLTLEELEKPIAIYIDRLVILSRFDREKFELVSKFSRKASNGKLLFSARESIRLVFGRRK